MKPISIILPVYNGIKYLRSSVESVLQQSFYDFEFLIVDDCSTDSSWEYLSSLKDNRIKLFRNKSNRGLFNNLNFLINQSDAPLIKLWTQDDIMYSNCIEEIVAFHQKHNEVGFSYTGRDYIDGDGNLMPQNSIDETPDIVPTDLHTRIAFFTGSIAGNIANATLVKNVLEKTGLFNADMKISGDFDMWVRVARYYPIGFIRAPLVQLRNHKGQLSRQEQYYIHHLKEDIQVYKYLFNYINEKQKREGKNMLRNSKLLFYYTLMLKALFKGHIKTAYSFFKTLNNFDSIIILSWFFLHNRIIFKKKTLLINQADMQVTARQYSPKSNLQNYSKTVGGASPFISVLMTAYNREQYIAEAIESILASTYTNFELVIVDDGSTDTTLSIIRSYETKDSRIKVFANEKNLGDYPNRNKAVSLASGKYIKFVDSDDLIYPYTLQAMVDSMEKYPEAAMGICQFGVNVGESYPEIVYPETIYKQHFYGKAILRYGPTGTIINREMFNILGGFSPKRYIADTEFWLKLSAVYPIIKLEEGLIFWRIHPGQEYYVGTKSHSYFEIAYRAYINSLSSDKCPLAQEDIDRIKKRLQWKHARDILSVAFKSRRPGLALRIYKKSNLGLRQLVAGILPYKIVKSRFQTSN